MDDGISTTSLRNEWSMLIYSFLDNNQTEKQNIISQIKVSDMSLEEVKKVKRELSENRKKLNQDIEKIKNKIEQVDEIIDNLFLVGSDATNLLEELELLNIQGEKLSGQVIILDRKIKRLHDLQDEMSI